MVMTRATEERQATVRPLRTTPSAEPRNSRGLVMVGASGMALAVLLFALGAVMRSNANFSQDYVARQLAEQRITFKPVDALSPEERQTECLVRFQGQPLTTGKQAECYANSYVGRHQKSVADGKTYSELREVQTGLRAQVAEAQVANDPRLPELQRQLADVTAKRQTLFEGESVRGLLLTSYGFSTLGAKADQAATVATAGGAALLLLSLVLLARAMRRRSSA